MSKQKMKVEELLNLLLADYPEVFTNEREKVRPLAVGIHTQLYPWAKEKGYSGTALRRALSMYCGRSPYLYALGGKQARVNLAGEPAGEVTEAQAKWARQRLRERKKQKQLRAKASAPAKAAAPQPEPTLGGIQATLTLRKGKAGVA